MKTETAYELERPQVVRAVVSLTVKLEGIFAELGNITFADRLSEFSLKLAVRRLPQRIQMLTFLTVVESTLLGTASAL
jgi:hypothetical protein